jgi:hypothetical protein
VIFIHHLSGTAGERALSICLTNYIHHGDDERLGQEGLARLQSLVAEEMAFANHLLEHGVEFSPAASGQDRGNDQCQSPIGRNPSLLRVVDASQGASVVVWQHDLGAFRAACDHCNRREE